MAIRAHLFFFKRKNFFLFSEQEVADILKEKFDLESITVNTTFPNIVDIQVKEKIASLIFTDGDKYMIVGLDGKVIEPIQNVGEGEWRIEERTVTSTDEFGNEFSQTEIVSKEFQPNISIREGKGSIPIVYDGTVSAQEQEKIKPAIVQNILAWHTFFYTMEMEPTFAHIFSDNKYVEMHAKNSVNFLFRIDQQRIDDIELLVKKIQAEEGISPGKTIDLRYKDKIYIQ